MNPHVLFALSFGFALATACGGSSIEPDGGGDGSLADGMGGFSTGSGGGSGGSSGAGSSGTSSSSSGGRDGGRMACTIGACPAGQVCCVMGCQAQSACGAVGNRQLCMSNADCPAAFPACRGGGGGAQMTCRACATSAECPSGETCCMSGGGAAAMANTCGATCPTGTNPVCQTAADCTGGLVCCQFGCQAQSACGSGRNRQICTSNADCPAAYPDCRAAGGGGTMYCRAPVDAGASDAGGPVSDGGPASDVGPPDSGSTDSSSDAPGGG